MAGYYLDYPRRVLWKPPHLVAHQSPCLQCCEPSIRDTDCKVKSTTIINGVNNQQDATTFSFINLIKSAQHASGDKFAHPQEHLLTAGVYTTFGIMHRHCCRPLPRLTVATVGSRGSALDQKLYIHVQSKSTPEDGRICRPKYVGLI